LIWLAARPAFSQKPAYSTRGLVVLKGWASWYGEKWRNHFTASGQKFKPEKLTAASPTLPLGSIIEVTNLLNGRVVHLVVNDRGPVEQGRILDVSEAAAELLGFVEAGVTKVRIRLLETAAGARKTGEAKPRPARP
jgi:rare lipoprotein A